MVILQDLAEKWLSCKICEEKVILQDSCKFIPVELSSYLLPLMQHISFWPEIYLRISCVFFKRNIKLK